MTGEAHCLDNTYAMGPGLESWIRPSQRQMVSRYVAKLVVSGKISIETTDDQLLWCSVNMTESPDSVLSTLGAITTAWGPPIICIDSQSEARYLFNSLHGRVRDSAN